jgi:two-component system, chemotaxis family, sensor kinase CheA
MSGFDLSGLLPFYLDETDEQIAGLNELLLKLEQEPGDEPALREAFRLVHSIKGSSTVMGFLQVKELTHHLETFFDQIRAGQRALDRPFLDLCFRCLDALRDYHTELRAQGQCDMDLTSLRDLVIARLEGKEPDATTAPPPPPPEPEEVAAPAEEASELDPRSAPGVVAVRVTFEPNIPWPDMKARLVLNRLTAKGRMVATEPPVDKLDEVEGLRQFTVWLASDGEIDEFHALADVDGVASIDVTTAPRTASVIAPASLPEPVATRAVEPSPEAVTSAMPAPAPAPAQTGDARKGRVAETVRVDADRLDHLMNLAGELVINKARFAEIARGLEEVFRGSSVDILAADTMDRLDAITRGLEEKGDAEGGSGTRWAAQFRRLRENFRAILDDLDQVRQGRERINAMSEAIHHLGRVSDGIQKGVLETRMVPIGPLFDRFQRVVRDLRVSSNKEVTLDVEGEKTELDKRMIDELSDPLVHMVRNSVDHGLELPEVRVAAGKPRVGRVLLAASHRGNSVVITVSDDGRGIDCSRVRNKAVSKGLLSEEESRRLTDRQIIPFIFHPGLSTAEKITDISGRGVGMDIVKSRIETLNGTVDVRSELGVGTTFTIRLPLTLAIMPVILVRVGGEAYAIPLDHLAEIVEVQPAQVYRVQGRRSIEVRGRIIALVKLADLFSGRIDSDGDVTTNGKQTVVVVTNGESTVGLVVDHLLGMQEAVLKSLEKNFRPVPGLSGASILGDGRVSLILDIDALIEMSAMESVSRSA